MRLFGPPNVKKMKAKSDIKGLIKALDYRKTPEARFHSSTIRYDAAKALGQIGDPRAVEPLIAELKDGGKAVAEALGEIGDPRAIDPLMIVLKENAVELGVTIESLGKQARYRAAAKALVKLHAVDALMSILKDKHWLLRKVAADALGEIGDLRAVEPLGKSFRDEPVALVRKAVVEALGKMGGPQSIEPLITGLKDKDGDVQKAAAEAFDKQACIPDQKEAELWYWIAKQDSEKVLAFGTSAIDPLVASLIRCETSRVFAAEVLGEIGDSRAVEPLISALKDDSYSLPKIAAHALGQIGDLRAVEPLISALRKGGRNVSVVAADALCKIGDDRAVAPLIEILSESIYPDVREVVAKSLGEFGNVQVVEPLISALKDKKWEVRRVVARQLIKMYHAGILNEQSKEIILAHRNLITTAHNDSYDPCLPSAYGHTDDGGIGLDFPL